MEVKAYYSNGKSPVIQDACNRRDAESITRDALRWPHIAKVEIIHKGVVIDTSYQREG